MKILLSSLAGMTLAVTGAMPLIINNPATTKNIAIENQSLDTYSSKTVETNEQYGITENSTAWVINNYNLDFRPTKLTFSGDSGMSIYNRWGNATYGYSFKSLNFVADGQWRNILDKDIFSGLAKNHIRLDFFVENTSGNTYKLNFKFRTIAYNSFSTSWGKLDITNQVTFSN